jgi:hypothetical protein
MKVLWGGTGKKKALRAKVKDSMKTVLFIKGIYESFLLKHFILLSYITGLGSICKSKVVETELERGRRLW